MLAVNVTARDAARWDEDQRERESPIYQYQWITMNPSLSDENSNECFRCKMVTAEVVVV